MNEKRGAWYLLTGVILGTVMGVLLGWGIAPVQVDTVPSTLRSDFKDQYRYMIAAAYSTTGNLERARARIALLEDTDPARALDDQAQRMLANNTAQEVVRALADLSQALQNGPGSNATSPPIQPANPSTTEATASPAPSGIDPDPSAVSLPSGAETETAPTPGGAFTPLPTPIYTTTPRPSHTPTSTPGPPFELVNQSTFCEATRPGLLQVELEDASGEPVAGIELVITWLGGEEHFFTGLKPELGNGYADFVMTPDVEYTLSISNGGTPITGLITPGCSTAEGSPYSGGILLEFKQP